MGNMAQLEYVIRGVKRMAQVRTRVRLPITLDVLKGLKRVWQKLPNQRDASMLWAAAMLYFFGFLRTGEVVVPTESTWDPSIHLVYGDLRIDSLQNPQVLEVHVKASKTDPYQKGVHIYLGRASAELCPVVAVLDYMVRRGQQPGPFFVLESGRFLTRERFVKAMREALTSLGYNCSLYAGHSFRIGAATVAAQHGVQDSLIKTMGCWESAAYLRYIRTPKEVLRSVAATMTGGSRRAGEKGPTERTQGGA